MIKKIKALFTVDHLNDAVGVVGAIILSYGFYLAWAPLGFICGGAMLLSCTISIAKIANRSEQR